MYRCMLTATMGRPNEPPASRKAISISSIQRDPSWSEMEHDLNNFGQPMPQKVGSIALSREVLKMRQCRGTDNAKSARRPTSLQNSEQPSNQK